MVTAVPIRAPCSMWSWTTTWGWKSSLRREWSLSPPARETTRPSPRFGSPRSERRRLGSILSFPRHWRVLFASHCCRSSASPVDDEVPIVSSPPFFPRRLCVGWTRYPPLPSHHSSSLYAERWIRPGLNTIHNQTDVQIRITSVAWGIRHAML